MMAFCITMENNGLLQNFEMGEKKSQCLWMESRSYKIETVKATQAGAV